jgi:hypothetical protein
MGIKRFDVFGLMQANGLVRLILKEFRNRLKMREGCEKCIKFCHIIYICLQNIVGKRNCCFPPPFSNQNN